MAALQLPALWTSTCGIVGPFRSTAGNYYIFGQSSATAGAVRPGKASDLFGTWVTGTERVMTAAKTIRDISAWQSGDGIHFCIGSYNGASSVDYDYAVFDMSTDSWVAVEFIIGNLDARNSAGGAICNGGIASRSDGSVAVIYNTARFGTNFARIRAATRPPGGGTWTHFSPTDDTNTYNYQEGAVDFFVSSGLTFYQWRRATGANEGAQAVAQDLSGTVGGRFYLWQNNCQPYAMAEMSGGDLSACWYNVANPNAQEGTISNVLSPSAPAFGVSAPVSGSAARQPMFLAVNGIGLWWGYVTADGVLRVSKSTDQGVSFALVPHTYTGNVNISRFGMSERIKPLVRGGSGSGNVVLPYVVYDNTLASHVVDEFIIHNGLAANGKTVGSPVFGTPILTIPHKVFVAVGKTVGSPVFGTSTLVHIWKAINKTVGSPVIGLPALVQKQIISAVAKTVGSPVIGSSALAQPHHAFVGVGKTVGSPVFGKPSLASIYNFTTSGKTVGSPVFGVRALFQKHVFTSAGKTVSSPVLGSPAFGGLSYTLTATAINVGSPVLGHPVASQVIVLTGASTATAPPVLGKRLLFQKHVFIASPRIVSEPVLGTPILVFTRVLVATGKTVGSPILGKPAVIVNSIFAAIGKTVGSPVFTKPAIKQVHTFATAGKTVSAPVLGARPLVQKQILSAIGKTVSSPVLGTPTMESLHDFLDANGKTVGSPILGKPSIGQYFVLVASGKTVSAPVLDQPTLGQLDALAGLELSVGSPALGQPSIFVAVWLAAARLTVAPPLLDAIDFVQCHVFASGGKIVGSPVIGKPALKFMIRLVAVGKTVGSPVLAKPALGHGYKFFGVNFAVGPPVFDKPDLYQSASLRAIRLTVGRPFIGKPSIGQYYVLTANDLSVRRPRFSNAWLTYEGHDLLFANNLAVGSPVLPVIDLIVVTTGIADSGFDVLVDSGVSTQAESNWYPLASSSAQPAKAA